MRPIKLEIQGMHSFVDNQVFDFDNISGNKMFGIFGPTGSGKSTVLDAIVLALYGNVWRSKTKADFVNLKTKKSRIVFTFSCIEKGKQKTYEVERTFKLNGDGEALQKAQVFECSAGSKVQVAEGVSKVDFFLFKLIGLNENEFAKCIALPQGEFAGFLKAKPNERISVIGGIFDLNKYGEEIAEKVRRRVAERKNELTAIASQMEIYSDIKQEDIDNLKQTYSKLKEEIEVNEKTLADYEQTIREEEDLAVLQREYDKISSLLSTVLSEGVDINDKRLKIQRAKKINDNNSIIETVLDLRKTIAEDDAKIEKLQEEVNGERLNLGAVVEDNKHRVEVLEESIKLLLDRHIGLENAKTNTKKLSGLKDNQSKLISKSEKIEIEKTAVSQNKHDKEMLLSSLDKDYQTKRLERDVLSSELAKYDDVAGYRILESHKNFIDGHIKFLDMKINKALNLKVKASEKIDETLAKEDSVNGELYTLRLGVVHGNNETKIDDSTIADELYKKMALLNKLNVTEEYVVNLTTKMESLKEENGKVRESLKSLETEKTQKYQTYVLHVNELSNKKDEFDNITKKRLTMANKNAVAEFAEKYKIGDVCPICNAEIMTKNVIGKLSSVVADQQVEDSKIELEQYQQRKVDELYEIAKIEQRIENLNEMLSDNEKEISRLDKEIIEKCSKLLNKKGARLADINIVQLQIKNEVADIKKCIAKEAKLIEKLNCLQLDKIKYNTAFVSAGEKCADYSELMDSLAENRLKLETQMSEIVGDSDIDAREKERLTILKKKNLLSEEIEELHSKIVAIQSELMELTEKYAKLSLDGDVILSELKTVTEDIELLKEYLKDFENVQNFDEEIYQTKCKIDASQKEIEDCNATSFNFANKIAESETRLESMKQINGEHKLIYENTFSNLMDNFAGVEVYSLDEIDSHRLKANEIDEIEEFIANYDSNLALYTARKSELEARIGGKVVNPNLVKEVYAVAEELENNINKQREDFGRMQEVINSKQTSFDFCQKLKADYEVVSKKLDLETELSDLLRGKALLEYVAEEFIDDIAYMASDKLQELMDGRYVLKYKNKEFYVIDNFNEGSERSVNTLSGGEIFVVSLALALSISDAIMSRSDKRIDFFFLDEGFGTLDKEYCEYIVEALTKLSNSTMTIGLISHIPELQEKIKKKFIITKATEKSGSKVRYTETY